MRAISSSVVFYSWRRRESTVLLHSGHTLRPPARSHSVTGCWGPIGFSAKSQLDAASPTTGADCVDLPLQHYPHIAVPGIEAMSILDILSRRYDVEILLSKEDLSPELRTRLSEELDRLDAEAEKLVEQSFAR